MKKGTPGIIISKIKPGSRASVSGLKPYEIITRINGVPVYDVNQFNKLINGNKELRFSVKRMFESRIVKIRMNQRR
jgi:S1-C subfamily serine protease